MGAAPQPPLPKRLVIPSPEGGVLRPLRRHMLMPASDAPVHPTIYLQESLSP